MPLAPEYIFRRMGELHIVPVILIEDADDAGPLGDALMAGGLPIAEVTFRTDAAEQSIRALAKRMDMLVGAGTVLNVDTARRAVDAGAHFIMSPGFNPKVVSWCLSNKIAVIPGTATATDIEMALDHGLGTVKFFPAEAIGGLKLLKALAAPYHMMRFVPTGGIDTANLAEYLGYNKVLAVGGSWMVAAGFIIKKDFDHIARITAEAVELARRARPAGK